MEIPVKDCEHKIFNAQARVGRLTDGEDGPVTGYTCDLTIICAQCLKPFQFIGLPGGVAPNYPTVSADGLEARIPIKPLI